VIAHAQQLARRPAKSRSTAPAKRPLSAKAKARQLEVLQERRRKLFDREIDYIPCRQFLKADAERLASDPPVEAGMPLDSSGGTAPAGLTPYLASLYQTRLLTKDEEQFYFRGRLDKKRATLRQIEQIEGWLTEAETVKAILITSNLRLVVSIAKKFVDQSNSFEELVSEGNVALMRAVEKFNFALGNRFSTYATYAIQRHFFRVSQKSRQLRSRFVPTEETLKDRAEEPSLHEYRSSEQIAELKQLFDKFLSDLEPREKQIVVARFGFDGKPPRTFRELGTEMGVCKERIRQIQTRAMDKLRDMAAEVKLEQTVDNWL
jgi:RNA polymerase primary sigma factor